MTILVAYVDRPEGKAALDKGIEIATRRNDPNWAHRNPAPE